ncbi:toprim domain-containing protein [Novispirillum itersonii]|uniref:toprim domain-containing protein n=1 Tax=Novispirillum itersonii TaxID=189 RepID=UPI00036E5EB1|nr:toprim domain-containing protein [Novispirillum itersonii]
MREDTRQEVLAHLRRDFGFKAAGEWLREGTCPSCGKKEVYAHGLEPWLVRCGRENRCGWSATVKDLYPDAFGRYNERFPATTEKPDATADAYMGSARGFDPLKIRGWYRQGQYSHHRGDRKTATVVFDIPGLPGVAMERLIEPVRVTDADGSVDTRKANFIGSHKGHWWHPPGFSVQDGDTLYLVEGCMDAIALTLSGVKAVATLSAGNFPGLALEALKDRKITLVWALDNDKAGRKYILRHAEAAHQLGFDNAAALIPQKDQKADWNDVYLERRLTETHLAEYRFQGALLLAKSAREKGRLIYDHSKGRARAFALQHDHKTYWFSIPQELLTAIRETLRKEGTVPPEELEDRAVEQAIRIEEIANCTVEFLYFQRDHVTDESWYYVRVTRPNGEVVNNTLTGAQVAASSEFKKRLLAIAPGALWTGNGQQLNWIIGRYLTTIKTVDTVDFIGYCRTHAAYILPDRAVQAGKVIPINDEDYFRLARSSVKTLNRSLHLTIGEPDQYQPRWVELIYRGWGPKGIIALVHWFGSLFAEQIRAEQSSYPFLEVVGEAGAGKTTLVEALWKAVGRIDYEGFDPNKASAAARSRIMTQVSNLPVVMIESDREDRAKAGQFDWDELKTAYNGRASRARGVNNGGNDTYEPAFRGSIVISQNAKVTASEAILSRIVHTYHDTSHHTPESKRAADELATMPVTAISHFLTLATSAEHKVMDTVRTKAPVYEEQILRDPEVRMIRIGKNHGQMMALLDALAELTNLPKQIVEDTRRALLDAAKERQSCINSDHKPVQDFWEVYDYIQRGNNVLNHSADPGQIAISLNHLYQEASRSGQQLPPLSELRGLLETSRSRKFICRKTVRSVVDKGALLKCWVFAAPKEERK